MKTFTKNIELVATLTKWSKPSQQFEVSAVGDVYLRNVDDAVVLAELWNPQSKSTRRIHLFPQTNAAAISNLLPIKFYASGSLWGKVYVQVVQTGNLLRQYWEQSGTEREAKF